MCWGLLQHFKTHQHKLDICLFVFQAAFKSLLPPSIYHVLQSPNPLEEQPDLMITTYNIPTYIISILFCSKKCIKSMLNSVQCIVESEVLTCLVCMGGEISDSLRGVTQSTIRVEHIIPVEDDILYIWIDHNVDKWCWIEDLNRPIGEGRRSAEEDAELVCRPESLGTDRPICQWPGKLPMARRALRLSDLN